MKKLTFVLITTILLVPIVIAIPANSNRYFVFSNNPALKTMFGVNHEFPKGFSTDLTEGQLTVLDLMGVKTEPVQLVYIVGKPPCDGDGICEPELGEKPSCSDCKNGGEEEPRTCEPSEQTPWGIDKVYGDPTEPYTPSGGAEIKVAVLDTGVYKDHLDLTSNIADCKDFTKGPRPNKNCRDGHGHGTHVAGTVAADGGADGKGIIGVAPEAKIMAYKVCGDDGRCFSDDIAAGIDYAAANGADIVSMSFGLGVPLSLIEDAIIRNPEVLYVAAAGNFGPNEDTIIYPAAYPEVIAVGAIDVNEQVPDFSSRGIYVAPDEQIAEKEVEYGAPGVSIESTMIDGCYASWGGTSMATPHVSGLAAKLWQGNAVNTRSYLRNIATEIWDPGYDIATGFGLPIAPIAS